MSVGAAFLLHQLPHHMNALNVDLAKIAQDILNNLTMKEARDLPILLAVHTSVQQILQNNFFRL